MIKYRGYAIGCDPKPIPSRDFDFDFSGIHEIVAPADVRINDKIVARIRARSIHGSEYKSIRVWRLSPLGVELIGGEGFSFRGGEPIDLEIVVRGQRSSFEGLVVDVVQESPDLQLIGIRLSKRVSRGESVGEKRRSPRWLCSNEFFPTCVGPSPGRFNDYIYFQIRDVSSEGLQLTCSLRNKYLIPDVRLTLTASFPMIGETVLSLKIIRVGISSESGKDHLVVGTEFLSLGSHAKRTLGQYLVQFSNLETLDELRDQGLVAESISRVIETSALLSL